MQTNRTGSRVRTLTQFALLVAVELILGFTPLGLIMVPPVAITIMHIPVIICGVVMGPLLGRFEFDLYGQTAAWYSLTVLLLLFALARRWVSSPWGATLMAVRDNPLRAAAIDLPRC